jgi:DNA-binding GntR family transcriptional regulator
MKKIPEYRRLYELLRHQIAGGVYGPGDLLPSESELKAAHGLSQPTVRKAVELLEAEGFVQRRQGKGSIVQDRPVGVGILSFEGDILTTQYKNPKIHTAIVVSPRVVPKIPVDFGFPAGAAESENGFYYLERLRIAGEKIIFHEALCIPNLNLPRFRQIRLENASFYEALFRHYMIVTTAYEQRFWAAKADEIMAARLKIRAGDPVQRLQRKFSTNRPGFYIYSNLTADTQDIFLFSQSK